MEFTYRTPTNRAGVVYDPSKFDRLFAEDTQGIYDALTLLYSFGDYCVSSYLGHPQNLTASPSYQLIKIETIEFDPMEMWDIVAFKFVAPLKATYKISANIGIQFGGAPTAALQIAIYKNGAMVKEVKQNCHPNLDTLKIDSLLEMNANDTVQILVLNPTVASVAILTTQKETWFNANMIRIR